MTHPRRQALASALKAAREATGLKQEPFAVRTGLHQTSVARFENGRRLPSEDDLAAWARVTGGDLDEWLALLRATRDYSVLTAEAAKTPGGVVAAQDELEKLEVASSLVAEYQLAVIPGLAQTVDYAYEWLAQPGRPSVAPDTDWRAVAEKRLERQNAVLGDQARRVVVAVPEAALWAVYGTVETQQAQLEHLAGLVETGTVNLVVAPRRPALAVLSGFELLDDVVSLETAQGLKLLGHPNLLIQYREVLATLEQRGTRGADAVALVRDVAARL